MPYIRSCQLVRRPFFQRAGQGVDFKIIQGAPHGMCSTPKDHVNAELLAFLKSVTSTARA